MSSFLPGIAAAQQAPIFDWDGTVQVSHDGVNPSSSSFTLNLRAGESKTYYVRLTKRLPIDPGTNIRQEGWWVRVHVEGKARSDGEYHTGNPPTKAISWAPQVGWEFNSDDWGINDPDDTPSLWRGITSRHTRMWKRL